MGTIWEQLFIFAKNFKLPHYESFRLSKKDCKEK